MRPKIPKTHKLTPDISATVIVVYRTEDVLVSVEIPIKKPFSSLCLTLNETLNSGISNFNNTLKGLRLWIKSISVSKDIGGNWFARFTPSLCNIKAPQDACDGDIKRVFCKKFPRTNPAALQKSVIFHYIFIVVQFLYLPIRKPNVHHG